MTARRLFTLLLTLTVLTGCTGGNAPPVQPSASQHGEAAYTGPVEPQDLYRTYYEIFVGSFCDSDGDGAGDLAGITEQLDYLNDCRAGSETSLHVTGLWLMPIHPSPTYHKYDVTDYYSIDPAYGTLSDFSALAAECDARGVSLILDLVVNHTSDRHPWFLAACAALAAGEESEYLDWYQFTPEAKPKHYPVPGADGWYYNAQFWSGMPDLNLESPAVRDEILKIASFWLDAGADGFRLDAVTSYYEGSGEKNAVFLRWLQEELSALRPDVYLVGEAWTDGGSILTLYGSGLTSFFNYPFSQSGGTLISNLRSGDGAAIARAAERWHTRLRESNPAAIDAPFLTNHDNARSAGALMSNPVLQKQAAAVYLLLPGNPFLYYGEELGMKGGGERDEDKRMPFVWSTADTSGIPNPPPGAQNMTVVECGLAEQLVDGDSLARFYIATLGVRNRHPALARGTLAALDTGEKAVCAYTVTWQGETLAVYHNVGQEPVQIPAEGSLIETLAAGGEAAAHTGGILTLPPNATAILRR